MPEVPVGCRTLFGAFVCIRALQPWMHLDACQKVLFNKIGRHDRTMNRASIERPNSILSDWIADEDRAPISPPPFVPGLCLKNFHPNFDRGDLHIFAEAQYAQTIRSAVWNSTGSGYILDTRLHTRVISIVIPENCSLLQLFSGYIQVQTSINCREASRVSRRGVQLPVPLHSLSHVIESPTEVYATDAINLQPLEQYPPETLRNTLRLCTAAIGLTLRSRRAQKEKDDRKKQRKQKKMHSTLAYWLGLESNEDLREYQDLPYESVKPRGEDLKLSGNSH
ncbi:hypothetical protein B0H11DRAFT_2203492 [Mycena galericulata]|nr:hypothetical protein B0H11DRAFT_2203492 [Mycena galericulata]